MKKDFTMNQIFKSLLVLAFAFATSSVMAQYKMIIHSPSSIAGDYDVSIAAFGNASGVEVKGDAVLVDDGDGVVTDGCQVFTGTTGKVAFIDRGDCDFVVKCNNAMSDNAIAVVVCNNESGAPISMTGNAPDVTIPCVMASMADCAAIKVEIANGVNLSVLLDCDNSNVSYPANIIWGDQPGQGDFAGGINDWSIDNTPGWTWNSTGRLNNGSFTSIDFMTSMTSCNGSMLFDASFLDNEGTGNQGSGACTAGNCVGSITSPNIDLSAYAGKDIVLQFTQSVQQWHSTYTISYSNDGGSSWVDTVEVNKYLPTRSALEGDVVKVALKDVAGTDKLQIRFTMDANYYVWGIDDVMIIEETIYDGYPSVEWFSRYGAYEIPVSQVDEIVFMADVWNSGNQPVTNAVLNVKVFKGASMIHEDNKPYGDLAPSVAVENLVFDNTFQVPSEKGKYTVTYELLSDNDSTPDNNKVSYEFFVTEDTFRKIPADASLGGWRPGGDGQFYTVGSIYTFPNESSFEFTGTEFELTTNNDTYSGFIDVVLYKWLDLDSNGEVAPGERIKIASANVFVSNQNVDEELYKVGPGTDFEFEIEAGQSMCMEADGVYILALHVAPGSFSDGAYFLRAANNDGDYQYNYAAADFAFNELSISKKYAVRVVGADASDAEERTFGTNAGLVTRLPFYMKKSDLCKTGTEDLNNNISASIFPNPAINNIEITLELETVSDVNIELVNLEGKVISTSDYDNVISSKLNIDVTSIPTGVYIANIRTNEGFISKRVVIQK